MIQVVRPSAPAHESAPAQEAIVAFLVAVLKGSRNAT